MGVAAVRTLVLLGLLELSSSEDVRRGFLDRVSFSVESSRICPR